MNKSLIKYNNLSKPLKASLWFFVLNILFKWIFLTLPIFSRLMTPTEYRIVRYIKPGYTGFI